MDWKKALIGRFPIDKGGPVGEIPLLVTNIALISTGLSTQYRNEHLALRCHDSSMYNISSCHPIRYLSLRSQAFVLFFGCCFMSRSARLITCKSDL